MKISGEIQINTENYRKLVRTYLDLHLYPSALFWADKVVSLSGGDPIDVYWLGQCMYLLKQYHRAAFLIKNRELDKTHIVCKYLAGKCLLEAREYTDALALLNDDDNSMTRTGRGNTMTSFVDQNECKVEGITSSNLRSAILYLKGRVHEALDNRSLASDCYKQALMLDVQCYDAFEALVKHQMLTSWEERELMTSLPFAEQLANKEEEQFVKSIYESLLKKYQSVPPRSSVVIHPKLAGNLDLEVARAEQSYYGCAYTECYSITSSVLGKDPYHMTCLPVHIACLVELKKSNALFYLAHDLVDLRPDLAVSWFAVGCYYYLKGKTDPARRYLGKATSLDRLFGPAWLAYGHSFAVENEHDQAMAAYFKASQLMKGCHLPLLYIGLECGLTNNIKLAEKFFLQAKSIAPADPFVIHEMGVVAYQNNDFEGAEKLFEEALLRVREINEIVLAEKWEPLFNNLGHVCRKLKKYEKALEYHRQALVLSPLNPSTMASMGFVQVLMGETSGAVESFHKALGQRRDDTFSTTMLTYAMEQLVGEYPAFEGADTTLPEIVFKKEPGHMVKFEAETPQKTHSPSSMSLEVDMQDSFQDENNT